MLYSNYKQAHREHLLYQINSIDSKPNYVSIVAVHEEELYKKEIKEEESIIFSPILCIKSFFIMIKKEEEQK